jgi:hypothetical protein
MVNKGEGLSTLPNVPLPANMVKDLESNDRILLAKPLPDDTTGIRMDDPASVEFDDGEETTRRIVFQTPTGGYLVEYLPPDGWIVIRSVNETGRTEDEVADILTSWRRRHHAPSTSTT